MMGSQYCEDMIPPRKLLRTCRGNRRRPKVADLSGQELCGGELLTRSLILRRLLRREVLAKEETHVGLLLPPSVAAVVANAALSLDGRVTINLNYTFASEQINFCIREANIRHVLASRLAMRKFKLDVDAELVYLEDFRSKVTKADKLAGAAQSLLPVSVLERWLGLTKIDPDDVITVVFTSGTTGRPKGVMLTHRNVGSNIAAFDSVIQLEKRDTLAGIVPLFHSLGFTTTLWTALTLKPKVAFHYTPLEAGQVGELCRRQGVTILIATPTFLRLYAARCQPEDFATVEVVITGAERLPRELAEKFEKKLGVRPIEGYGVTELSPVVSLNVPPGRMSDTVQRGAKEGTVGQTLPGVSAKVVDLETGEDLGVGKSGMLLVAGPNVMKGYMGRPDATAAAVLDGWYVTEDLAMIDEEGFITITGRVGSFSKIGGEMVSHAYVEERLFQVLLQSNELDEESEEEIAVVGVPDPKKGERLVVLHTGLAREPEAACRRLSEAGVAGICIPSPRCFHRIDEIPVLGTGKRDLKRIKEIALELEGS